MSSCLAPRKIKVEIYHYFPDTLYIYTDDASYYLDSGEEYDPQNDQCP